MMRKEISGWVVILFGLLYGFGIVGCKTTRHISKDKQQVIHLQKKDSTASETAKVQTTERSESKWIRDIDTTLHANIRGDVKIPKPTPGKTDTTAVYDSLGNKLGIVASSLDSQNNALNLHFDLGKDVHAKMHEEGSNKSEKSQTEDKHKESALHSQGEYKAEVETVQKDVVRKTDLWVWAKVLAGILAVIALVVYRGKIWKWFKNKILKK